MLIFKLSSLVGLFPFIDPCAVTYTLMSIYSNIQIFSFFSIYILPSLKALKERIIRSQVKNNYKNIHARNCCYLLHISERINHLKLKVQSWTQYHHFQNNFSISWHQSTHSQVCKCKYSFTSTPLHIVPLFSSLSLSILSYNTCFSYYYMIYAEEDA